MPRTSAPTCSRITAAASESDRVEGDEEHAAAEEAGEHDAQSGAPG